MTGYPWLDAVIGVVLALMITWLVLIVVLLAGRPQGKVLTEALRLLPDLLRLLARMATDKTQPAAIRIRLALLLAYLALPIDLVPDFIPVLGYADDAIIVVWVLRSIARHAGVEPLHEHWPGTDDGFAALCRLSGLPQPTTPPEPTTPHRSTCDTG